MCMLRDLDQALQQDDYNKRQRAQGNVCLIVFYL